MTRALAGAGALCVIGVLGGLLVVQAELHARRTPFLRTWVERSEVPVATIAHGKARAQVMLHRATGLASAAMTWLEGDPGFEVPAHVHEHSDELIYIIEGGGTLTLRGRAIEIGRETALWIPKGDEHSFRAGSEGVRALQVYAPGGPEQRFLKRLDRDARNKKNAKDKAEVTP